LKKTAIVLALLCAAGSACAFAQTAAPSAPAWHAFTIHGGCTIELIGEDLPPGTISWNGTCTPGQPISGQGVLRDELTTPLQNGLHVLAMDATFVSGVPNGTATLTGVGATETQVAQASINFNMGCQVYDDGLHGCPPYAP
jgi:hypothetical protein